MMNIIMKVINSKVENDDFLDSISVLRDQCSSKMETCNLWFAFLLTNVTIYYVLWIKKELANLIIS